MARADDDAFLGVEVALAERPVVVRAPILDRAEGAAEVVDAEPIDPATTILTRPGGSSSTGATSIVAIELQLVGQGRPLLGQRRSLGAVQRDLQHAEAEDRALEPHGRQRDADLLE